MQQAKLRGLVSDLQKYKTAFEAFYLEYNAFPGDMRNAQSYWPSAQNGNGDKYINWRDNTTGATSEVAMANYHLSQAGLISGEFDISQSNTTLGNIAIPSNLGENTGFIYISLTNHVGQPPGGGDLYQLIFQIVIIIVVKQQL